MERLNGETVAERESLQETKATRANKRVVCNYIRDNVIFLLKIKNLISTVKLI